MAMTLTLQRPLLPLPRRLPGVARESLIIAAGLAVYTMVRILVRGRTDEAIHNGRSVIHLEQSLGIFQEHGFQRLILAEAHLGEVFKTLYLYGHLPVIGVVAILVYYRSPSRYVMLRNAMLISGAVSLLGYGLFPAAPPRLIPDAGFVDTVFAGAQQSMMTPKSMMNEYAAMPSLHFAWSVLVAVGLWSVSRNPAVRAIGIVWPLVMLTTIVSTANHYLLDAAGGFVAVSIGLAIAGVVAGPGPHRQLPGRVAGPSHHPRERYAGSLRPEPAYARIRDY